MLGSNFSAYASSVSESVPPLYIEKEDLIQKYSEELQQLEQNQSETLSQAESDAGYQIIDGQKYAPEELIGEEYEEIEYGGVPANSNTGYVNLILNVPEYIHETAFVHVINANNGKLYGCKNYEINGYASQLCLPSGIYIVNEGGLLADTTNRFYVRTLQFQVKPGSQQDIVIDVYDTKEELKEQAYEETSENEKKQEVIPEETESSQKERKKIGQEKPMSVMQTVLLTVLFTSIPLAGIAYLIYRSKKNNQFHGFDEW